MRCSESAIVTSGSLPMSTAEMLSWIDVALRFSSTERCSEARMPALTTTACSRVVRRWSLALPVVSAF